MEIRALRRNEIEKVRGITRDEVVEQVYYFVDGSLVLRDEFHDMKGWNASELDRCVSRIYDIYDRNGILLGAFVKNRLVGVSVLDSEFIGKDKLQLYFHHVDNNYRHRGVGGKLFRNIVIEAKELGAKSLYVSATPSKNTIGFYLHMGCRLASEVHTKLFELESKDIHLDFLL